MHNKPTDKVFKTCELETNNYSSLLKISAQ